MGYIPWCVTLLRLIVPISILRFPLFGILISIIVDASDWHIIHVTSAEINTVYQSWDKAMDVYGFLPIVWVVLHREDIWSRRVALSFFGYRMIGVLLFEITHWQAILLFFPNVFENFVILCLIIFWLSKKKTLNLDPLHKAIMLSVLIIPKMIMEYFQHFLVRMPWEIFSIGNWLGFESWIAHQVDIVLYIGLLYIVPVVGFLIYIRGKESKRTRSTRSDVSQ